jgi:hypothetical protein
VRWPPAQPGIGWELREPAKALSALHQNLYERL